MAANRGKEKENNKKKMKKETTKEYEKYVKQFTPKPKYFTNCIKAFVIGGLVCICAHYIQDYLIDRGMSDKNAGAIVTMILICSAQLLTGLGLFDSIAKFAGAGVIVPITGFANSMVAPAIEYKKEGLVLGIGSKLFSLAGPVLVYGLVAGTVVGVIYNYIQ